MMAIQGPGRRHRGDVFCPKCGHWHGPDVHPELPPLFPVTPAEHHALHCESRPIERMGPLEFCPFRAWHETQEPRTGSVLFPVEGTR